MNSKFFLCAILTMSVFLVLPFEGEHSMVGDIDTTHLTDYQHRWIEDSYKEDKQNARELAEKFHDINTRQIEDTLKRKVSEKERSRFREPQARITHDSDSIKLEEKAGVSEVERRRIKEFVRNQVNLRLPDDMSGKVNSKIEQHINTIIESGITGEDAIKTEAVNAVKNDSALQRQIEDLMRSLQSKNVENNKMDEWQYMNYGTIIATIVSIITAGVLVTLHSEGKI